MFNLNLYKEKLYTCVFGQSIQYYSELDSTNTKAWELISEKVENGTVVITDNQLKGRGRQSNKWISIPGKSLTFSIILYPNALPNKNNLYSLLAGLAITDCLNEYGVQAKIKWPNDILIKGKKVGGILCESKINEGVIKSLVIGIGINVNENITEFPEILHKNITSLMIESGTQNQLEIVLTYILIYLENRIQNQNETQSQLLDWENHCAHLNKKVTFHTGDKIINGRFKGLSSDGQAIVTIHNQEVKFDSGELIS